MHTPIMENYISSRMSRLIHGSPHESIYKMRRIDKALSHCHLLNPRWVTITSSKKMKYAMIMVMHHLMWEEGSEQGKCGPLLGPMMFFL